MSLSSVATSIQEAAVSPDMAHFRFNQTLEDCQNKAGELSGLLDANNLGSTDLERLENPVIVAKDLLELLKNLDHVNKFVISKNALKPAEKSVKEALRLSLESFCNLYESCRHSQNISKDIFDSSASALKKLENSLLPLLEQFVEKLSVRKS